MSYGAMNRNSLSALLKNRQELAWEKREIGDSGESINWLKVFSTKQQEFGLTDDGIWRAQYSNGSLTRGDYLIAFICVLEIKRSEFIEQLRVSLEQLGLPEPVVRTFPFDETLYTALKVSNYWHQLALGWIEDGYPISPQIAVDFPDLIHVVRWQNARMDKIINA